MRDSKLIEYKFESAYKFANIISEAVESGFDFWNFNGELFVQSALKFNEVSLLHIYTSSTLYCYYLREFRKNSDIIDSDEIDWWIQIMSEYGHKINALGFDNESENGAWIWFQANEDSFMEFFDTISDEIVHILFNDKWFLVKFNKLVRNVILDEDSSYVDLLKWPEGARNNEGTIRRCAIPQWVKRAVYHRDKGRCVFCNKDLTGIVNTLNLKNFDHIVPLKDYGTNDPCNIQLTCEECNKSKGARDRVPKYKFQSWW